MNNTKNYISNMTNSDQTLNENYFIYDQEFTGIVENAYAYVDPSDSNQVIYLNPEFFANGSYLLDGFDSLPGVIAHEASHFHGIGDTQDYGYGNEALDLVITNKDEALMNADNYEYFLESGPDCIDKPK